MDKSAGRKPKKQEKMVRTRNDSMAKEAIPKKKDIRVVLITAVGTIIVTIGPLFIPPVREFIIDKLKTPALEERIRELDRKYAELGDTLNITLEGLERRRHFSVGAELAILDNEINRRRSLPLIEIFGINLLGPLHQGRELFIDFLADGGELRLLFLDVNEAAFKKRAEDEDDDSGRMVTEWMASGAILADIIDQVEKRGKRPNLEVRLYAFQPRGHLVLVDADQPDGIMIRNQYPEEKGERGFEGPTGTLSRSTDDWVTRYIFGQWVEEFRTMWKQSKPVEIRSLPSYVNETPFVSPLEKCQSFEFTEVHRLGPGQPLFGHVQGLEVNERFFFVTSTTENRDTAYLYVYLREGDEPRPPVQQYDLWKIAKDLAQDCGALEDGPMSHPSGIHLAGGLLYVALARSENRGPSCIMALDLTDLLVPKVEQAIRVEDHVGALVRLHYNDIIGFNWDSDDYWWLELGAESVYPQRATVKEMLWEKSAEKLYLQDCDQDIDLVLCGQNGGGEDALVKIYKVGEFGLEAATLEPRAIRIPPLGSERGGTYEGLAWYDGQLFLMPDDGDETGVNIYELGCIPSSVLTK